MRDDWRLETAYPGDLGRGIKSKAATRRLQEWLALRGSPRLKIDGDFGAKTENALRRFRSSAVLDHRSGPLDATTWDRLVLPMRYAFSSLASKHVERSFGATVVSAASRFLREDARELPPNKGPWVRAFMKGRSGRSFPWCAGFVSTCIDLAAEAHDAWQPPLPWSWSCTTLLRAARREGRWIGPELLDARPEYPIRAGDLLLVMKGDATSTAKHIGIVTDRDGNDLLTIEGNTNASGSAEGVEVARQRRGLGRRRYGLIKIGGAACL